VKGRTALEWIGLSVLGIVLFHFQVTILIFVIPLVILYKRQGYVYGILGSLLVLFGIAGFKIVQGINMEGSLNGGLLLLDMEYPFTFLLGIALVEAPYLQKYPVFEKMALATLCAGVLGIPLIRYVLNDPVFDAYMKAQINTMLKSVVEGEGSLDLGSAVSISTGEIVRLSKKIFANTYTVGYFLTLLINWTIGSRIGMRTLGYLQVKVMEPVHLPEKVIWGFLIGWLGVLVSLWKDMGWIGILAWNVALLGTVLYGLQGVDILKFILRRMERFRSMVIFAIILCLFMPGLNIIILIGVPLLGVSDLWIQYDRGERS